MSTDEKPESAGTTEDPEGAPMTEAEGGFPGEEAAPGMGNENNPPRDSPPGDGEASRDNTGGGLVDRAKKALGGDDD